MISSLKIVVYFLILCITGLRLVQSYYIESGSGSTPEQGNQVLHNISPETQVKYQNSSLKIVLKK